MILLPTHTHAHAHTHTKIHKHTRAYTRTQTHIWALAHIHMLTRARAAVPSAPSYSGYQVVQWVTGSGEVIVS